MQCWHPNGWHNCFFPLLKGIDYSKHEPAQINLIPPPEVMGAWREDYSSMGESMIYGTALGFNQLIDRLKELTERLRAM